MSKFEPGELVFLNLSHWNIPKKYLCQVIKPVSERGCYSLKLICRKDLTPKGYMHGILLSNNVFETGIFDCLTRFIDKLKD